MKTAKRLLSLLLVLATLLSVFPSSVFAASVQISGIDVSVWQGTIDWAKVKAAGINYAIMRIGYNTGKDTTFEANYAAAKANGINVGVYYYSIATTTAKALEDAKRVEGWLAGKQFEYPIYIDIEDSTQLAAGMTTALRTSICTTFNDYLASKGYYMGVYANKNWYNNYLDYNLLKSKYTIWWAQYPSNNTPTGIPSTDLSASCDIWQYSSKGIIDGITQNTVDMNVSYKDFASIIVNGGYNGFSGGSGGSGSGGSTVGTWIPGNNINFYNVNDTVLGDDNNGALTGTNGYATVERNLGSYGGMLLHMSCYFGTDAGYGGNSRLAFGAGSLSCGYDFSNRCFFVSNDSSIISSNPASGTAWTKTVPYYPPTWASGDGWINLAFQCSREGVAVYLNGAQVISATYAEYGLSYANTVVFSPRNIIIYYDDYWMASASTSSYSHPSAYTRYNYGEDCSSNTSYSSLTNSQGIVWGTGHGIAANSYNNTELLIRFLFDDPANYSSSAVTYSYEKACNVEAAIKANNWAYANDNSNWTTAIGETGWGIVLNWASARLVASNLGQTLASLNASNVQHTTDWYNTLTSYQSQYDALASYLHGGISGVTLATDARSYVANYSNLEAAWAAYNASAVCQHTSTSETVNPATCTANGTKTVTCNSCGAVISTTTIAATGHTAGSWVVTSSATCTANGSQTQSCTKCGVLMSTQAISATGHSAGSWVVVTPATCTSKGSQTQSCTKCGTVVNTQEIPVASHSAGSWVVATPATCTDAGTQTQSCTVCKTVIDTKVISATGHSAGEWVIVTAPTETADGLRTQSCTVCGNVVNTEAIPMTGHTHVLGEWVVVENATCTSTGTQTQSCTACGNVVNTYTIPMTGHTAVQVAAKAPTCTEIGWNAYEYCTNCDYTTYAEIAATGHNYTNGVCSNCGIANSAAFTYAVIDDTTCKLTGYIGDDANVQIPSVIDGYTVVRIETNAFARNTDIANIVVPDTVTEIGNLVFIGCTNLTGVTIPESVTAIGNSVFLGCKNVTVLCFENSYAHTYAASKKVDYAFIEADGHTLSAWAVTKAPTCTEAGTKTKTCTDCGIVVVTKEIAATGHAAGEWVTAKASTCTEAGTKTLSCASCGSLISTQTVPVSEHSYTNGTCTACGTASVTSFMYTVIDGTTCKITGYTGTAANVVIPSVIDGYTVVEIATNAFARKSGITSIIIPDTVTDIGNLVFISCANLTSVTIPDSVTNIGNSVFLGCKNVTILCAENSYAHTYAASKKLAYEFN